MLIEGIWLHLGFPFIEYLRITTLVVMVATSSLIVYSWRWKSALLAPLGIIAAESLHEWIGGTLYILYWNWTAEGLGPVILQGLTGSPTGYFGWYALWVGSFTGIIWFVICKKPSRLALILLLVFALGMIAWIALGFHSNKASLVLAGIQRFDYVGEFFDVLTKSAFVLAFGFWKKRKPDGLALPSEVHSTTPAVSEIIPLWRKTSWAEYGCGKHVWYASPRRIDESQ